MTEKEKLHLLEETFELDPDTLTPETVLEDTGSYDSMTKLSLIVMVDDEFGVRLTGDQVRSFVTVQDILDCLKS